MRLDRERRLKPFFDFRNSLIHRYWIVKDDVLIKNCREGHTDFQKFIDELEVFLEKEEAVPPQDC